MDQTWLAQMRKGTLELCILALLDQAEMYGYAVVEHLGRTPGLEVTESTVYPILARLASDGALSQRVVKSTAGPPRRYYSLSESGKTRLLELTTSWLTISKSIDSLLVACPTTSTHNTSNPQTLNTALPSLQSKAQ